MQYTYWDVFSTAQNNFLNLSILMPFSASAVFLFHLFHVSKTFPFEDFFHWGNQKKSLRVNKEGGAWGHAIFGQKLLNTQVWAGAL